VLPVTYRAPGRYEGLFFCERLIELAARDLGIDSAEMPLGHVRVLHGSTPFLDEGYGAFASRSTVLGGSAVFKAANALLAKIRTAAGARLGCPAEQVELADGCARALDGPSLAFAELAADGLRVTTAFGNDNRLTYTYGSAAAHVAVDPGTGDVELLDCLVVEDVGRIVNPLTLHGQAIGGMVQGLGGAFLEHLVYDANGQLLAGNLAAVEMGQARQALRLFLVARCLPWPVRRIEVQADDDAKIRQSGYLTDLPGSRAVTVVDAYAKSGRMIRQMDPQIGRVLEVLDANGVADNTIVVFTSDNGGERYANKWPFTGRKTELLEGGLRIPAVIHWPGYVPQGSASDQVMIDMDWLPTLLAAAGTAPDPAYPSDGMNLMPWLTQRAASVPRKLFWRYKYNDQQAAREATGNTSRSSTIPSSSTLPRIRWRGPT
jgi:molybdopterin-binding aldehyde dehydrogenase-like protein/sulfatase-like protein